MIRLSILVAALLILGTTSVPAEPACQSTQSITACKARAGCVWATAKNKKGGKCVPVKVAPTQR